MKTLGYQGYGVLNVWSDDWDENWWVHGPYCSARSVRDDLHEGDVGEPTLGPWRHEVDIVVWFLNGKSRQMWLPVERLNRSLWLDRFWGAADYTTEPTTTVQKRLVTCLAVRSSDDSAARRFEWSDKNNWRQVLLP